jgi:hypothetical protein
VPDSQRPAPTLTCLACGAKDGMKLHNVSGTMPVNIPLLYVCQICGIQFTVPPPPIKF